MKPDTLHRHLMLATNNLGFSRALAEETVGKCETETFMAGRTNARNPNIEVGLRLRGFSRNSGLGSTVVRALREPFPYSVATAIISEDNL